MHIGFDAKRFFHNATGLGNYSRSTVFGLGSAYPEHHYILFDALGHGTYCTNQLQNPYFVQDACLSGKLFPALWRSFALPYAAKKHNLDIFHGLSHELPTTAFSRQTKTIVTMHDLIFLTHPHLFPLIDRTMYRWKYAASCRKADLVLAVSQKTAEDTQEFFNIPADRIKVAYQSCHPDFYAEKTAIELQQVRTKYGLSHEFILFVGSLIQRKGCHTIVEALSLLEDKPELIIVGTGPEQKNLETLAAQKQVPVRFLGKVVQEDLPGIYQLATLFVYPSFVEGFGIPIIEALFSKTPVITSTGSCFSEPGGTTSIYVQPGSAEELSVAIATTLQDTQLRTEMIEHGLAHAQQFHIRATSAHLMSIYQEITKPTCP